MNAAAAGIWWPADLELRQEGSRIAASFPYNSMATIRASGTVRKERIMPGAFRFAIEDASRDINLLVGHDYGQPLASKLAGTLVIRDTAAALEFEAPLPDVSWARMTCARASRAAPRCTDYRPDFLCRRWT